MHLSEICGGRLFPNRITALMAAVALALSFFLLVTGSPAQASVITCTTGTSGGNVRSCLSVINSGPLVATMSMSAHVVRSARVLRVRVLSPSGAILASKGPGNVPPGGTITAVWRPHRVVARGRYCGITARRKANGTYTRIATRCVTVS